MIDFGEPLGTPNNFLFQMGFVCQSFLDDSNNAYGIICQLYIYASVYTREVKHYNMMICEDVGLISFLFGMEAIYRIDCLLAHSVISMNGGRPKAALVGLRFTCPCR